tara:strand:- start:837 stop:1130 length:294 start_codon:yes stop_codon:yes gene_type:complete
MTITQEHLTKTLEFAAAEWIKKLKEQKVFYQSQEKIIGFQENRINELIKELRYWKEHIPHLSQQLDKARAELDVAVDIIAEEYCPLVSFGDSDSDSD